MKITAGRIAQAFILLVIAGLSLVLVVGMWRGKAHKNQQQVAQTCPTDPEMKLTDMEFTEMQHGKRFWTLCASEAKYFQDEQKTFLQSVHLTFYLDKGGEEIQLYSKEGVLHAGTKNIELHGAVRAELPRGYVVTMDKALYDHQKRLVWSEVPVNISGPGLDLDGKNWEYKIPEQTALIGGGVHASLVTSKLKLDGAH